MSDLSENYYLRECYFRREQVPTISVMKKKMTPPLAAIYFNTMKPKVKVLAGLEPSLKGGGSDWYQPPEELLAGRAVLKPIRKTVLEKLTCVGIDEIGTAVFWRHRKAMDLKIEQALIDSDQEWKNNIVCTAARLWEDLVLAAKNKNTEQIKNEFNKFVYLYRQSLGKIEILFHESAIAEINKAKQKSLHEMQIKYATVLKHQATLLYDEYEKKLMNEKDRLKVKFIEDLENNRTAMAEKIHDLNVDKHTAFNKISQCLHCQNLACEVYVSLKEREECLKETEESKYQHEKRVKVMKTTIMMQDFQIRLEQEKEKKRLEFCNVWRKKVFHVVKAFQMFVSHCLNMFPEQAEFFINMEKLMLLHVSEVLENPSAISIIEPEGQQFHTPIPRPKPFYLFCDVGYKPKVDSDLCPKYDGPSSTWVHAPAFIINHQCLYAACDNFEQFTNKIKAFLHGHRGDEADFDDNLVYEHFVPVKYTNSQQLLELKLESSLLKVLQQEIAHLEMEIEPEEIPVKCNLCGLSWCTCRKLEESKPAPSPITPSITPPRTLQPLHRNIELVHEREPNWESFCKHIEPKKCRCAKTIKKHLTEHLPAYMRRMKYVPSELPDYEICPLNTLKTLVKEAKKEIRILPVEVIAGPKDVGTQCEEFEEFLKLCTCFSDPKEVTDPKSGEAWADLGKSSLSSSALSRSTNSFAKSRTLSLKNLLKEAPEIKEIFVRRDDLFQ